MLLMTQFPLSLLEFPTLNEVDLLSFSFALSRKTRATFILTTTLANCKTVCIILHLYSQKSALKSFVIHQITLITSPYHHTTLKNEPYRKYEYHRHISAMKTNCPNKSSEILQNIVAENVH